MTDIHSHVLPRMDDGSKSVEESLSMLAAASAQGIRRIVATPHFYPFEDDPRLFLERRSASEARLREAMGENNTYPRLCMGAETYYFDGISKSAAVDLLRIAHTELLLLEMPFEPWSDRMIHEILHLQDRPGITVLMAHIERYLRFLKPHTLDMLREHGVLMQSNAEFFLMRKTKRQALRMLRRGQIHFLGSDCHNTGSRPQRMGEALAVLSDADRQYLEQNLRTYFGEP